MTQFLFIILIINFIASTIFCTFGFGDALIAIPILSTFIPLKTAAPYLNITGLILTISIIIKESRHLSWKDALFLDIGSLCGVPIGIYVLKNADENNAKIGLGIVIIIISLFKLFYKNNIQIKNDWWGLPFGFLGGILGGAFNCSGPAVVIYASLRQWEPKKFVSTLQAYFLPTNLFVFSGFLAKDLITFDVKKLVLFSIPGLLAAMFLGGILNKKIKQENFQKYIYYFLLVVGVILIVSSALRK